MIRNEQLVLERIANDLKDHAITVKHDDGMYRHWRCQKPGSWNMGFDVVTWPGCMAFTGDMGEWLFERTEDMLAFMRTACNDYQYSAQKVVAGTTREWSEHEFRCELKKATEERSEFNVIRRGIQELMSTKKAVARIIKEYEEYGSEHDAMKAMYESGLWDEIPDCKEYTFRFLWALHAIRWFCERVSCPAEADRANAVHV